MNRTCPDRVSMTPAVSAAARASWTAGPSPVAAATRSGVGWADAEATRRARRVSAGRTSIRARSSASRSRGTGSVDPATTQSLPSALAISSAKKGLPSDASWMRRRTGRGHERPSRAWNSAWSAPRLSGPSVIQSIRSGGNARSTRRLPGSLPSDRCVSTSPTGSTRSRRNAKASAAAVGRSSHWASSTTRRTRPVRERSRRSVRKAVETAPWSRGASGSSRSSATARARRCGAGIVAAVSS